MSDAPMQIADSAVLSGNVHLGPRTHISFGAVLHDRGGLTIGAQSMILENCVAWGSSEQPCRIGRKTVFGHRTLCIGATVGDLCEVGNAAILMPGAKLGDRCILGEGTLIPAGVEIPAESVILGRPGRIIRRLQTKDHEMLSRMRGGDLSLPDAEPQIISNHRNIPMQQLYDFRDKHPHVDATAALFPSVEILGDVVIGAGSTIGPGVKIIGDSHGPVRIGARVQIHANTVLHLLPSNELVIEDDVIIGPGAMIHGCTIGRGSVIEPGAIVCDNSRVGPGSIVRAGSLINQRAEFGARSVVDGFPGKLVETLSEEPGRPVWAFADGELAKILAG